MVGLSLFGLDTSPMVGLDVKTKDIFRFSVAVFLLKNHLYLTSIYFYNCFVILELPERVWLKIKIKYYTVESREFEVLRTRGYISR